MWGGEKKSSASDSKKDGNIHVSVCGAKAWIRLKTVSFIIIFCLFLNRYCCTNKALCMYGLYLLSDYVDQRSHSTPCIFFVLLLLSSVADPESITEVFQ